MLLMCQSDAAYVSQWMNLEAHLDLIGYQDSTAYGVVKHLSWWNWVVWRVSFPTFLFFGMVMYVIPHYGGEGCYIMSYITGITTTHC